MKPALLIDVDGVLCPFGGDCPDGYEKTPFADLDGWVYLCTDKERLPRLQRSFDLFWATAWEHRANEFLLPYLGLEDPLPVIEFNPPMPNPEGVPIGKFSDYTYPWKLPWIGQWAIDNPRPLVWIDDDCQGAAFTWAYKRTEAGIPTEAEYIKPENGLTDRHIENLEAWAAAS